MKVLSLYLMLLGILLSNQAVAEDFAEQHASITPSLLASMQAPRYLQSLYQLPEQQITTPKVHEFFTDDNTRTLFVLSDQLPIVDIQLSFNAGSARDLSFAKDMHGLASLTAKLLDKGTTSQTANEIAQNFERVGAQYSAQAYKDMFIIKLRVLSDPQQLMPALEQLIGLLQGANFPQQSINDILNHAQVGQKQAKENPESTLNVRFYRALYKNHPYAEPSTGTMRSLEKIKSEDIFAFKARYLVANNLNIAITGNVTETQVQDIAQRISHSLDKGEAATALPDAEVLIKPTLVNLSIDTEQAHIMIGTLGIKQQDPDRLALEVGNQILGGQSFNSLLTQVLREENGYSYNVASHVVSMQSQGVINIDYATHRDHLEHSLALTYQTLFNFLQQPLDPRLVEDTKRAMLRAYPQMIATNANINALLGMMGFYQLPSDYLESYPQQLAQIQASDIQAAWQRHFNPQNMLTVIVGKDLNGQALNHILKQALSQQK